MRETVRVDWAIIGAAAAALASAFAVFVAIDQLTATSRQRRLAEFLRGAVEAEPPTSPQREVLDSVRRETVSRLVGASAVSVWTMAGEAGTLMMFLYLAFEYGRNTLLTPSPTDVGGWWNAIWPGLVYLVISVQFTRRLIRLVDERRRIADDFLAGKTPLAPQLSIVQLMEGGRAKYEWLQATVLTAGLLVFALGVGGLAGVTLAGGPAKGVASPALASAIFSFVGAIVASRSISSVRTYLGRRRGYFWKHPMPQQAQSESRPNVDGSAGKDVRSPEPTASEEPSSA